MMRLRTFYSTIVLSDIHLGTSHSKTTEVTNFLKSVNCRRLVTRHPSDVDALSANTLWPAMGNEQLLQLPQCRSLLHVEVWRIQGKEAGRGGYVTVQVGKATAGRFLTSSFFILHLICYLCN